MKKYKNQLLVFLLALIAISNFYCSGSNTSKNDSTSVDTSGGGSVISDQTPPGQTPSELTRLQNELERVKASVRVKEKEYLGYVGDANASALVATSETASDEDKELAQERVNISLDASKKSKLELEELQRQQAELEEQINTLKNK